MIYGETHKGIKQVEEAYHIEHEIVEVCVLLKKK